MLCSISPDFYSTSRCCQKRLGSGRADEPDTAFNPIDKEIALLKATSGHQASVIVSFDGGGEGGTDSCEGLTRQADKVDMV